GRPRVRRFGSWGPSRVLWTPCRPRSAPECDAPGRCHIRRRRGVGMRMTQVNQNPPSVSVRSLRKTWPGGVEAVRGVSFAVAPGEVFGLLGPNGAGKSTTIGMLTTAVRPSDGVARIAGLDVQREPTAARAVSGIVFQDAVVDQALTGRQNLVTHARLW